MLVGFKHTCNFQQHVDNLGKAVELAANTDQDDVMIRRDLDDADSEAGSLISLWAALVEGDEPEPVFSVNEHGDVFVSGNLIVTGDLTVAGETTNDDDIVDSTVVLGGVDGVSLLEDVET